MRPELFHIPIHGVVANILPITLVLSLLLLAYVVWQWIIEKKDFPSDAGFFFLVVFVGGMIIFGTRNRYEYPDHIPIYAYGFMLMVGFAMGIPLACYRAKKANMDPDIILDVSMWIIISGVVSSRVFYVLVESPEEFKGQGWGAIFRIWQGGLTFYGGMIGATIVALIYFKIKKLDILKFVDILSPSLMLGLGFGRVGCFLNGCCWGSILPKDSSAISWSWPKGTYCYMQQMHQHLLPPGAEHSLPVYFTQFYSAIMAWSICILLLLFSRYIQKRQGMVFGVMLILYGIGRFIVEYYRADNAITYLGGRFTISQMVSLSGVPLGILAVAYSYYKNQPVGQSLPPAGEEKKEEEKEKGKNNV